MRARWSLLFGLASLFTLALPARAQTPTGPEFQVSSGARPAVAGAGTGFVLVWRTLPNPFETLVGRRYDPSGTPQGSQFKVSTYTLETERADGRTAVAAAADGRFVVVWESRRIAGSGADVFARRFNAAGSGVGVEFRVNASTTGDQEYPSVAVANDGTFVVAWQQPHLSPNVFARRFDATGAPLGEDFRVNTATTAAQPDIAAVPSGGILVVWTDVDGQGTGVSGQRYDAAGIPVGPQFRLSTSTLGDQGSPSVAFDSTGAFLAVWEGRGLSDTAGVFAQRYDAAGNVAGSEFRANRTANGTQMEPDVAREANGHFFVSWLSLGQDGDSSGVFGQLFDPQGARAGAEFQVNTYTTGYQGLASVASNVNGRLLEVWENPTPGPNMVRGQALGGLRPTLVAVDDAGNGVAEPGETVSVAPIWLNTTGGPITTSGTAVSFTGPAGGTYSINDGASDYGTIENGSAASCGVDCLAVTVTAATRPALHWDAVLNERLTTGHRAPHTIHLGDSFADVAHGPFYRFIETLLHNAVSSGCGPNVYCPGFAATRDQMAVFVMVSKEGPGYTPPACNTAMFSDVPPDSPYCRWIEELARRGVVGGCGGGRYCPADAVTREQMAVFVLSALDPDLSPPSCTPPNMFDDVPQTSPYCRWIEELARRDVVSGCGGGNYCPSAFVTREQMSVFLSLTFGLRIYGP